MFDSVFHRITTYLPAFEVETWRGRASECERSDSSGFCWCVAQGRARARPVHLRSSQRAAMPTCGVTRRRGSRSRRRSVPLVVELGKGGAQLLALRVEVDEDAREPAFALVRQAEVGDARIGLGLLALDQSCPLGSADEFG